MHNDFVCCRDCPKRYVGCHSECEEYLQAKEEREKKRLKIRQEKDLEIYHEASIKK